jgi:microcystin-dependent protein
MSGLVNNIATRNTRHHPEFPVGTKMVFNQTAAPTGWTKVTGIDDDQALRVTTGTVGTGGDVAFETAFTDRTFTPTISRPTASSGAVSAHTLAISEIPDHTHQINRGGTAPDGPPNVRYEIASGNGPLASGSVITSSGGSHTHSFTQPTISIPTAEEHPLDINVKFVDVIIATKD